MMKPDNDNDYGKLSSDEITINDDDNDNDYGKLSNDYEITIHDDDNDNNYGKFSSDKEVKITKITSLLPERSFPAHKYRTKDVDKILDNTHAEWKLEINSLDWLSIKERGNQAYKSQEFNKAQYAFLVASRKCNNDRDKTICLVNLSAVYFSQKDFKGVVVTCDDCLEIEPEYVKVLHRRSVAQEILGNIRESLNDASYIQDIDSEYPNIDKTIVRLNVKLLEANRLQGLKLLKESKVQFHLILTFEEREQECFDAFITPADISEIDWIRKVFFFCLTGSDRIRDLVKISSCQFYAEQTPHLTFLANRHGQYYFNADNDDGPDTAYWNQFRNSFLETYIGPFPFVYLRKDYENLSGYSTMNEFF